MMCFTLIWLSLRFQCESYKQWSSAMSQSGTQGSWILILALPLNCWIHLDNLIFPQALSSHLKNGMVRTLMFHECGSEQLQKDGELGRGASSQHTPSHAQGMLEKETFKKFHTGRCQCLCIKLSTGLYGLQFIRARNLTLPLLLPAFLSPLSTPSTFSFSDVIALYGPPTGQGIREGRQKERNKYRKQSKAERGVAK